MWFLHDGTGKALYCLTHGELDWLLLEPDTGLDRCPRILLLCFRARTSESEDRKFQRIIARATEEETSELVLRSEDIRQHFRTHLGRLFGSLHKRRLFDREFILQVEC